MTDSPEKYDGIGKKADAPGVDPDGYKIGYGKPPRHTQWKKGQCGNKKGRQRRNAMEPYGELIERILRDLIPGFGNGKAISITKCKGLAKIVVDRGIAGEPAFEDFLIQVERPDLSRPEGCLHWVEVDSEDEIPPLEPQTQHRPLELFPDHLRAHRRRSSRGRYGSGIDHAQVQPKQTRIPRGRPRNDAWLIELIRRELHKRIKVQENGKTRCMTKREAWMRRIINSALNGNARAWKTFVKVFRPTEPPPEDNYFYLIGSR
jgi:hypothetical protein